METPKALASLRFACQVGLASSRRPRILDGQPYLYVYVRRTPGSRGQLRTTLPMLWLTRNTIPNTRTYQIRKQGHYDHTHYFRTYFGRLKCSFRRKRQSISIYPLLLRVGLVSLDFSACYAALFSLLPCLTISYNGATPLWLRYHPWDLRLYTSLISIHQSVWDFPPKERNPEITQRFSTNWYVVSIFTVLPIFIKL